MVVGHALALRVAPVATVIAVWLLLASAPAAAATRYAEPGGNGPAATCPQSDPCDIQIAIEGDPGIVGEEVANGDEIVVLPGTYVLGASSSDELDILKNITVHGDPGEPRPVIQSAAATAMFMYTTTPTVRWLRIEHTGSTYGLFVWTGTVEQVEVIHSAAGGLACHSYTGTIRDSVCAATAGGSALNVSTGGVSGTLNVTLRNDTVIGASGGSGIPAYGITAYTTGSGIDADIVLDAKNTVLRGDTDDASMTTDDAAQSVTLTLDHSNYDSADIFSFGAGAESITPSNTSSNQTAAPVFKDAPASNFHQMLGSPTIDAGAALDYTSLGDFEGEARTVGSAPDIGADEFPPPPETTITSRPPRTTTLTTAGFEFEADQDGKFKCRLDDGAYERCTSPKSYTGLALGQHVFRVRATNRYGAREPKAAKFRWEILP